MRFLSAQGRLLGLRGLSIDLKLATAARFQPMRPLTLPRMHLSRVHRAPTQGPLHLIKGRHLPYEFRRGGAPLRWGGSVGEVAPMEYLSCPHRGAVTVP